MPVCQMTMTQVWNQLSVNYMYKICHGNSLSFYGYLKGLYHLLTLHIIYSFLEGKHN